MITIAIKDAVMVVKRSDENNYDILSSYKRRRGASLNKSNHVNPFIPQGKDVPCSFWAYKLALSHQPVDRCSSAVNCLSKIFQIRTGFMLALELLDYIEEAKCIDSCQTDCK